MRRRRSGYHSGHGVDCRSIYGGSTPSPDSIFFFEISNHRRFRLDVDSERIPVWNRDLSCTSANLNRIASPDNRKRDADTRSSS